jgi:hypothetical protein
LLDSGGAYGRNWERNQALGVDGLAAKPAVYFDGSRPQKSVFHYLREHLTFAPDFDAFWQRFDDERPNESWLENLEEWFDVLGVKPEADSGFYEGGRLEINTYNNEYDLVDQVLQYSFFELNGADFIALQIHGGCDVRGGYTKPRIFRIDTSREEFYYDSVSASMFCQNCELRLDYRTGEIEACTDRVEDSANIDGMNRTELAEWFWSYENQNTCPNCRVSGKLEAY